MMQVFRKHKYKFLLFGALTYVGGTAVTYEMRRTKLQLEPDMNKEGDNPQNEKRRLVFDFLAMDYDDKVSRDEWLLGIDKKRYFH